MTEVYITLHVYTCTYMTPACYYLRISSRPRGNCDGWRALSWWIDFVVKSGRITPLLARIWPGWQSVLWFAITPPRQEFWSWGDMGVAWDSLFFVVGRLRDTGAFETVKEEPSVQDTLQTETPSEVKREPADPGTSRSSSPITGRYQPNESLRFGWTANSAVLQPMSRSVSNVR